MSSASVRLQSALAGIGAVLVDLAPVLLIAWAGRSGSVGDLRALHLLGPSLVAAIAIGAVVARLMAGALRRVARSPALGRFDAWGAYVLGLGVYALGVTAVPAVLYVALLGDENRSLRSDTGGLVAIWVVGHLMAALLGVLAGRALLGRELQRFDASPTAS